MSAMPTTNNYTVELMDSKHLLAIADFIESTQWSKQDLLDAIASPFNLCMVAIATNEECVGFCISCYVPNVGLQLPDENTTIDIWIIEVDPIFRRQKIGYMLMLDLLAFAKQQQISCCFLEVRINNKAAISLYEMLGFKLHKLRKNYYRHENSWVDGLEYCHKIEQ